MSKGFGKRLKNRKVGRTFKIERPAFEFCLVILIKADVGERLEDLLAAVVNSMGRTDESNDDIAVGGFVENDFGMAGGDDLRALPRSHVSQQLIDLALAKNFKMCVRFVEQENRLRIRVKVSEQQECLLQTAPGARKVEQTPFLVLV